MWPHAWDDQTCCLQCTCQGTSVSYRNVPPASCSGMPLPWHRLGCYVSGMTYRLNSPSSCCPMLCGIRRGLSGLIFSFSHRTARQGAAGSSCYRIVIPNSLVMGSCWNVLRKHLKLNLRVTLRTRE